MIGQGPYSIWSDLGLVLFWSLAVLASSTVALVAIGSLISFVAGLAHG